MGREGAALAGGVGSEIDDRSTAALGFHGFPSGDTDEEERAQVDFENLVPLFGGNRVDIVEMADPGRTHEHIDRACLVEGFGDCRLGRFRGTQIANDRKVFLPSGRCERGEDFLGALFLTVNQNDPSTKRCKLLGAGQAEAAASASDEDVFIEKFHNQESLYFLTVSSRTVMPRPGVSRTPRSPSLCSQGSETSSCCIGEG